MTRSAVATSVVTGGRKAPRTKLTDRQVKTLRERAQAGEDPRRLAVAYGITPDAVTLLVTGQARAAAGGPVQRTPQRQDLTSQDVRDMRWLYGKGMTQDELALKYGVSRERVKALTIYRRRW